MYVCENSCDFVTSYVPCLPICFSMLLNKVTITRMLVSGPLPASNILNFYSLLMQTFYLILIVLANANFVVFHCIMAGVMHLSILCPTTPLPGHIRGMEGYLTLKVALYMGNLCSNHYACTEMCYNLHIFEKAYNMTLENVF